MLTDLAKMATGLMARGGVGTALRLAAAAAMLCGAWLVYAPVAKRIDWNGVSPLISWETLLAMSIAVPAILSLVAIIGGSESRSSYNSRGYRAGWGLADFLRRAPFVCWCLMTDDGRDVPLWAILAWPLAAAVEAAVCVWLLAALPFIGLWHVLAACGRAAWRVLSVRPLDRGR